MSKKKGANGISPRTTWRDCRGVVTVLAVVDGWVMWRRGDHVPQVSSAKHFLRVFEPATAGGEG